MAHHQYPALVISVQNTINLISQQRHHAQPVPVVKARHWVINNNEVFRVITLRFLLVAVYRGKKVA